MVKTSSESSTAVINCRGIWKLYGENPDRYMQSCDANTDFQSIQDDGYIAAVHDVSLDIFEGEILVIMGLSGSGKSTLVRCLSRLIDITSGTIMVEGQDLGALSEQDLIELRRSKMGMVFQNFALLPHRNVLENVSFPLEMRGQDKHDCYARAIEMVKLVGLEGRENYFPRELSGGQQQRVGIARSLAIEPDIWFLDEPFSALDPLIRRDMQDEFIRLQQMLKKTIVFITHDFDEALRLADRIAIMKDGAIQQIDLPANLLLNPINDYVKRFTEEVYQARIVTVGALIDKKLQCTDKEAPFKATDPIHNVSHDLMNDIREIIPVCDHKKKIIGAVSREKMLDILLG